MQSQRDALVRHIERLAGKRGTPVLTAYVEKMFSELIDHVEWERREWEDVLNQLMQRDEDW